MHPSLRWSRLVFAVVACLTPIERARAQCDEWSAEFQGNELLGAVEAFAIFDVGAGPALYAGGDFYVSTNPAVKNIARWNGSYWVAVGDGVNASVRAMTVFDDGSGPALYVGGDFTIAGGASASRIARWDGSTWSALGAGMNDSVLALAVFDQGGTATLCAGGNFTVAGGMNAKRIAQWNGSTWSALGLGMASTYSLPARVKALTVFDDGSGPALYAGGEFKTAGGLAATRIARWNGSSWTALGTGFDHAVNALTVFDAGAGPMLFAGGKFTTAGGVSASHVAGWNGSTWSALGTGVSGDVAALAVFDDGSGAALHVSGDFWSAGSASLARHVAKWNGSQWFALALGADSSTAYAMITFDGGSGLELFLAGGFAWNGTHAYKPTVGRWNGSAWGPVWGNGVYGLVTALQMFDDGHGAALYAGGEFTTAGNSGANGIARWTGSSWEHLSGSAQSVTDMEVYDDGSGAALYASGVINNPHISGGIAKWNGAYWTEIPTAPLFGTVNCLGVYDDGFGPALYAGGTFTSIGGVPANRIAKWNGTSWSDVGGGTNGRVDSLTVFDDGSGPELCVGGYFTSVGGSPVSCLAKWNGSNWTGYSLDGLVLCLEVFDDGAGPALYAGGYFTVADGVSANHIAKLTGANWSALGNGADAVVRTLTEFDDGFGSSLCVGGDFTSVGGIAADHIARWDGAVWRSLAGGVNGTVYALAAGAVGSSTSENLYVGGALTGADVNCAAHIAQWLGCGAHAQPFCFGDGIDPAVVTDCPCANFGQHGYGCGNSVFDGGAKLSAQGEIHPDSLDLTLSDIPPGMTTLFLQGDGVFNFGVPFGDGVRCAGGALTKLAVRIDADLDGSTELGPSSGSAAISVLGSVVPGHTYYYQTVYRDTEPGWCAAGMFNISNGLRVAW